MSTLIHLFAFAFIVFSQVANGQYVNTSTLVVPYAQKYTFSCYGGVVSNWYYVQNDGTGETQITANDTFIIDSTANTLTIKETRKDQLNVNYVCASNSQKYLFKLIPQPYMYALEKSSVTVTEGGMATATCKLIVGFSRNETINWTWLFGGQPIPTNDTRIQAQPSNDHSESKLTIKSVTDADKGTYQCFATNPSALFNSVVANALNATNSYNHTITVRVKSTLAALWPFLAIIGEVIILCIIILIFEKKCGKKSSDDAKEEQSDTLLNKQKENENSDVKKRSVKA